MLKFARKAATVSLGLARTQTDPNDHPLEPGQNLPHNRQAIETEVRLVTGSCDISIPSQSCRQLEYNTSLKSGFKIQVIRQKE